MKCPFCEREIIPEPTQYLIGPVVETRFHCPRCHMFLFIKKSEDKEIKKWLGIQSIKEIIEKRKKKFRALDKGF